MARSIGMDLENPTPVYRAVILYLYPGVHNRPLRTYTASDGQEYQYHRVQAYGPYGSRGPATSQVTLAFRDHEATIKRGQYTVQHVYNAATRKYDVIQQGTVPEVIGFVEEQIPAWKPIAGTERTG